MNAIARTDAPKPLLVEMADKYGLQPAEFSATVRKTCGMGNASAEEFAAFIMVAKEYDLNPLLKEIYAFPAKGGGIVPIVSIDGWVNLVNSHPACDGFEFEFEHTEDGTLISCTCRMYRKDRGRPVSVTEYLNECIRSTEPWKMKHRMLRHKAMIQAARYAFGFSGIYDEDEGSKIAEMKDVTPPKPPAPPAPPAPPSETQTETTASSEPENVIDGEIINPDTGNGEIDTTAFFEALEAEMAQANSAEEVEEVWTARDPLAVFDGDDVNQGIAKAIKNRRLKEIGG
ncbi:recombinase RecT [Rhizobium mongolense]